MIVQIRKCDICGTRYENTESEFFTFGTLTDTVGQMHEVCPSCVTRILANAGS